MDIRQQYIRAIRDFDFFCGLLKVPSFNYTQPPIGQKLKPLPLKLHSWQKDLIKWIDNSLEVDIPVLKCRQIGASTVILAHQLHSVLYNQAYHSVYYTQDQPTYDRFVGQVKQWLDQLGSFNPGAKFRDNVLNNVQLGSSLEFQVAMEGKGRSTTYTTSIGDELAYWKLPAQKNIRSGLNISSPAKRIWLSTPKVENDMYHKLCQQGAVDNSLFYIDWSDERLLEIFGTEENKQLWYEATTKGLPEAQINREYKCQFKGAAENPIWVSPEPIEFNYMNEPVIVSMDLGYYPDPTAVLFVVEIGDSLVVFDEAEYKQHTTLDLAAQINGKYKNLKYGIMDSSGKPIDMTSGTSVYKDMIKYLGIPFKTRKKADKLGMKNLAQKMLVNKKVLISDKCIKLLEMFNNFEFDSTPDCIPTRSKYKHIHDAFVYLCYNYDKLKPLKRVVPRRMEMALRYS